VQPLLQWKSITITYYECVFVALSIQYAMRMRHTVVCGLPRCTIFSPHYLTKGKILLKKKLMNIKRVLIISTTSVWNISRAKKIYAI
jgi:hypothetical protein